MATKYPENTLFKTVVDTAYKAGKVAKRRFGSPKTFDTGQFSNLNQKLKGFQSPSALGTTTVPYGGSTRYEKFHPGVDVAAPIGKPIPSFTPGKVTQVKTGQKQGSPGYGNYVIVTDPYGAQHRYSHLHQSFVKVGQDIPAGGTLGTMGNTGQTYSEHGGTGSHLDYRILNAYKKYVNPYVYLGYS